MNIQEFEAQLKADNFDEITLVEKPIGYVMGEHQHPFDACALITAGDFTLVVDGVSTRYGVGEVFRLGAEVPHLEAAGPQGASYLSGRRPVVQA